MTYEKNYIGKGKRNEKINSIVKFTFKLKDLQEFAYEFEGEMYVSIETAQMKSPDKFSRTHNAWVAVLAKDEKVKPVKEKVK